MAAPGALLRQGPRDLQCGVRSHVSHVLEDGARRWLTSFSCDSLRDAMYTFAPFCTYADAIMEPMPEPPPVTTAAPDALRGFRTLIGARGLLLLTNFALHVEQRGDGEVYSLACERSHTVLSSTSHTYRAGQTWRASVFWGVLGWRLLQRRVQYRRAASHITPGSGTARRRSLEQPAGEDQ